MKPLKFFPILIIPILFIGFTLSGQDSIRGKPRLFETWIVTDSLHTSLQGGVLFEVKDSSLLISNTRYKPYYRTGNYTTTEIDFGHIESLKLRRVNSIANGAVIGASIGLGIAVFGFFMIVQQNEYDPLMIPAFLYLGFGSATVSGLTGALAGTIKTTIPLGRSYDNFSRNRAKLQDYGVVKKDDYGVHEHESYLALWQIGPSFTFGGFTDKTTEHYAKKNGYGGGVFNLGFLFRPNLGISVGGLNHEFDVADDNKEMSWMFTGIVAGPIFAFPAGRKFFLDLKPRIGFADVTFFGNQDEQTSVSGFVLDPCVTFRFNFAKRWSLISETGYYYLKTSGMLYGQDQYQAFNLNAGIAYRFR